MITKVHANNTVTMKYPSGKKEYLYNTEMLKMFKDAKEEQEKEKETSKIQTQEQERVKRTYGKRNFEGREDGGPVTRSKGTPVQPISASYASVVKNEKINLHPEYVSKIFFFSAEGRLGQGRGILLYGKRRLVCRIFFK